MPYAPWQNISIMAKEALSGFLALSTLVISSLTEKGGMR